MLFFKIKRDLLFLALMLSLWAQLWSQCEVLYQEPGLSLKRVTLEINEKSVGLCIKSHSLLYSQTEGMVRVNYFQRPSEVLVLTSNKVFHLKESEFEVDNIGNSQIELLIIEN